MPKKLRKYEDVGDEFIKLPLGKHWLELSCCDCGLVHKIYYSTNEEDKLILYFERAERATAQLRRHNHGQLQNKPVGRWKMVRIA